MPDFGLAEFAPYIAFMREHPQEREFREGDWYYRVDLEGSGFFNLAEVYSPGLEEPGPDRTGEYRHYTGTRWGIFWLPLDGDWLDKLTDAGIDVVIVNHGSEGYVIEAVEMERFAKAITRVEALARLCMAISAK